MKSCKNVLLFAFAVLTLFLTSKVQAQKITYFIEIVSEAGNVRIDKKARISINGERRQEIKGQGNYIFSSAANISQINTVVVEMLERDGETTYLLKNKGWELNHEKRRITIVMLPARPYDIFVNEIAPDKRTRPLTEGTLVITNKGYYDTIRVNSPKGLVQRNVPEGIDLTDKLTRFFVEGIEVKEREMGANFIRLYFERPKTQVLAEAKRDSTRNNQNLATANASSKTDVPAQYNESFTSIESELEALIRLIGERNTRLMQEIERVQERIINDKSFTLEQRERLNTQLGRLKDITRQNDVTYTKAREKVREILKQIELTIVGSDSSQFLISAANARIKEIEDEKRAIEAAKIKNEEEFRQKLFISFGVAVILLIVILIMYIIAKRIQRQKEEIALRMEEINRQNEEIRTQNEMMQLQRNEIEKKNQRLEELNSEKNSLMDIVAHDLKAPLNKVVGITQLLPIVGDLNEEQKSFVNIVKSAAHDGIRFIDDLLDINAIEQGHAGALNPEEVSLAIFMPELLRGFHQEGINKNIKVHFQNKAADAIVYTDKDYLRRIVDNLMSNAVKFSPPYKNIYVKVSEEGGNYHISIKDEGPGISEEDQKKMFRKFQKLSAMPTAGESSTGMGLSIVKVLVERMQGNVLVNSTLGKGSEFVVVIPKKAVSERGLARTERINASSVEEAK